MKSTKRRKTPEWISSGELATELGWSETKVKKLCRAKDVPYIVSKSSTLPRWVDSGPSYYTILDKDKFYEVLMEMTAVGETVTGLDRKRKAKAARYRKTAETRKENKRKKEENEID